LKLPRHSEFRLSSTVSLIRGIVLTTMFFICQTIRTTVKTMHKSKHQIVAMFLFAVGLLGWTTDTRAQQTKSKQPAKTHQILPADDKAIRGILRDQETAWNKHDMNAFTKAFRDDVQGINVVGMYWQGKAELSKHLTDFHATFLKDCEEYLEEVQVHSIGEGYTMAVSIWKVDAFTGPGGVEIPACRHRSTAVLAKGADGWQVVHFHNTTIDEAALKNARTPLPKK
jgi:uncharacterized protein (TIGR02246 family)